MILGVRLYHNELQIKFEFCYGPLIFISLPNDKILDLKEFADNNSNWAQIIEFNSLPKVKILDLTEIESIYRRHIKRC